MDMKVKTYIWILFAAILLFPQHLIADEYRERIYMQTDKQVYLAGELLWLKVYLTDQHGKPASLSKVGYIELLDATSAPVQIKVEIKDGLGEGWMELPSTLATGHYQLTAYTQYMRNEGDEVFFNKPIGVINTFMNESNRVDTTLTVAPPSLLANTVSVSTEKKNSIPRSINQVSIEGLPEDVYSLAVSITGKEFVPMIDQQNIYEWNGRLPAMNKPTFSNQFQPEYEGHIIKGKVVNLDSPDDPIKANVYCLTGFVGDQIRVFGAQVDSKNEVSFYTNRISGTHEIASTAYSIIDNRYRVDIQSPFVIHPEKELLPFKMNPDWEESLLKRSVGLQASYSFITDSLNKMDTTFSSFTWKPTRTYLLDEYTRFTTLEEIIIEFIPSLTFKKKDGKRSIFILTEDATGFSAWGSLVLLDGVPIIDQEVMFKYDPLLLRKIDVYRGRYVFDQQLFEGIISFSSYANNYPGLKAGDATQFFDYEGTQARRHFYAPSYVNGTGNMRIPDFRHTLLWEPNLKTEGKSSISVPFCTSDMTGEFQITVEGLTREGKVVRGVSFFEVKEE